MSLIKRSLRINILVAFSSLVLCLLTLLLVEASVRIFSDINDERTSSNLFITNAYGASRGNVRNSEAVAFGVKVYTDKHGFRISKNESDYNQNYEKSILILGDSVGFGVGVEADKTFAGLLSKNHPYLKVYNSSVIGYWTPDYRNVIDNINLKNKKINKVFLVFCLNDIVPFGAMKIDNALKHDVRKNTQHPANIIKSLKNSLKSINIIKAIYDFLRSRSKLYLLIRRAAANVHGRYWEHDYQIYKNATLNSIATDLEPILYIADTLRKHKVSFKVVIAPYEFQLRVNDEATKLPQKMLSDFFKRKHIDYIDAMPFFNNRELKSKDFFLPYDSMHFSEAGHEVIFDIMRNALE